MIDLQQLHDFLPQNKFELVSDVGAAAAVLSPWWLPPLRETSEIAAFLLPIFGVIWLLVQIGFKFYHHFKGRLS